MTDGARGLLYDWRAAPFLVKAFVISPVAGFATEWAYGPHARPGAFVGAAVIVGLLTVAVIRRQIWAWALSAVIVLVGLSGLIRVRYPVHRPLALVIALDLLQVLLLVSPPMLRWVGLSQRWVNRTGSGA